MRVRPGIVFPAANLSGTQLGVNRADDSGQQSGDGHDLAAGVGTALVPTCAISI